LKDVTFGGNTTDNSSSRIDYLYFPVFPDDDLVAELAFALEFFFCGAFHGALGTQKPFGHFAFWDLWQVFPAFFSRQWISHSVGGVG
jgi:hypothetical protein